MTGKTVKLTVGQAIVQYLINQHTIIDGERHRLFAKHAEAMGALARHCESLSDLENAAEWAQTTERTTVISINSDAYSWTPGGADWYVGVPEINDRQSIRVAREGQEAFRKKQRQGI